MDYVRERRLSLLMYDCCANISLEAYSDPMKIRFRSPFFATVFVAVATCGGCARKHLEDLPDLSRGETLWTGHSGSQVVLYRYGMAVGKPPEALVCEQGTRKDLIETMPADSFALPSRDELKVMRQSDQTLLQTISLPNRCP
jgi:hypothetical protein